MTGIRKASFSNDLDLQKMKTFCKQNGCTINDYTSSLVANSLFEYFDAHKTDEGGPWVIPDSISINMPFSLRVPQKNIKDVKLENDFVPLPIELPIRKTLAEELVLVKKQFKELRSSLFPYGILYAFKLSLNLPFYLAKDGLDYSSSKTTLNYTNLFASKVMYEFDGHKLHSFVILTPLMSSMTCGISVLTVAD